MPSFLCPNPQTTHTRTAAGDGHNNEERRGTWNLYDIGREKDKSKGKRIREKIRDRRTGKSLDMGEVLGG